MHIEIPTSWTRGGLVLARAASGDGSHVVGDPCVVRDPEIGGWRMFLFMDPPGHGQAVCRSVDDVGAGRWQLLGRLAFTNPASMVGQSTHKPYVVTEADAPSVAARIGGRYCLLSIAIDGGHKCVQRAWAASLAGPWTWDEGALIATGSAGEFDEKHVDAISGIHVGATDETFLFYMGYPARAQGREVSPYGNAQAVAVVKPGEHVARKLGVILPPMERRGHWASGWVGGLQVMPGIAHRWIGLANASPTAPNPADRANSREEPAPSLGGFAYSDDERPVSGWRWCDEPIESIEDIPADAVAAGEGTNLWRQNFLVLGEGRGALYYNSGFYGREQLYMKWARW